MGKVVGFGSETVEVDFEHGQYEFPPGVLYHFGREALGFKLGDSVAWETHGSYETNVLKAVWAL